MDTPKNTKIEGIADGLRNIEQLADEKYLMDSLVLDGEK